MSFTPQPTPNGKPLRDKVIPDFAQALRSPTGCGCPCHHGITTYHMVPCHPDGFAPRVNMGTFVLD